MKQQTLEPAGAMKFVALSEGINQAKNSRRWKMEEAFGFARKRREASTKRKAGPFTRGELYIAY